MRRPAPFAALIFAFASGCSAERSGVGGGSFGDAAGGDGAYDAAPVSDGGQGDDVGGFDVAQQPPPAPPAEVFGQSGSTLYKLDPTTKQVTVVGDFSGCGGSVIDIALDKDGKMYGTTFGGVYRIDKTTASCAHIASGSYPNSLSFVPIGTLDPNVEALVGFVGATYVRIDTTTGTVTNVGSLGGGYSSSGDVVSVIGGGTYLTVTGNGCGDCIVEVDPKTGALKKMIGPVGHASVFGLAFWGGSAYGFDDAGELFQIDLTTGKSTTIPIPNAPSGLSFYGAGSTTSAPLTPPS